MKWTRNHLGFDRPHDTIAAVCADGAVVKRVIFGEQQLISRNYRYYAHGPLGVTDWRMTCDECIEDYGAGRFI